MISEMSFEVTSMLTFEVIVFRLKLFEFENVIKRKKSINLVENEVFRIRNSCPWMTRVQKLNIQFQFVLFNSPFKGTCPYPYSENDDSGVNRPGQTTCPCLCIFKIIQSFFPKSFQNFISAILKVNLISIKNQIT